MARLAYNPNYTRQQQQQQQQSRVPTDSKQSLVDEDNNDNVLDDNILDRLTPDMSPGAFGHRRESFADSAPAFSPRGSSWNDFSFNHDPASLQSSTNSAHLFSDQSNQFILPETAQGPAYGNPQASWHPNGTPGSCTPTTVYDGFQSEYDTKGAPSSYTTDAMNSLHPTMYGGLPVGPAPSFQPNATLSTSPQSGQDWMSTSSSEHVEHRQIPKHTLENPAYSNPPLLRRDGIRKKNARFEIPAERTLRTIDHLINQTSDEQEIKELKQQKRLLRNRQAALDSRQRKKQHTERLEEEKKHTSTIINELEEDIQSLKIQQQEWAREKEQWIAYNEHCKQQNRQLVLEKEELVRSHTIETADLRKKNAFLTEQAQKLESISMSAVPSSTGYSADFSDFDHLTMENSPWDNFSIVNEFNMETEPKQENSLVALPTKERSPSKDDDKSATSGLLLMLLLCGAWVASNTSSTTSTAIPRMPDDVRVASAAVLENIYKDAGIQPIATAAAVDSKLIKQSPSNSPSHKTTITGSEFASLSHSPLSSLHHQLVAPTDSQMRDQLFQLSSDQYNNMASDEGFFSSSDGHDPSHAPANGTRRKPLAEALAAMRAEKQGTAAEVYTKSLMWDEIPTNVVRDFARMVAEVNNRRSIPGQQQEPLS